MTQNDMILAHLKCGFSLTPLDALKMFGCFRLASRISDLKKEGHNITKKMVSNGEKSYASYKIEPKKENPAQTLLFGENYGIYQNSKH
jgi:hypothetical protein